MGGEPARADTSRPRRWRAVVVIPVAVAALVLVVVLGAVAYDELATDAPRGGREILIDVPRGTADRVARGEPVDVLPQRIVATAGDTLRVVNHDDVDHVVGPFIVAAGQVLQTNLARPGVYSGECSLHRNNRVEIVVRVRGRDAGPGEEGSCGACPSGGAMAAVGRGAS